MLAPPAEGGLEQMRALRDAGFAITFDDPLVCSPAVGADPTPHGRLCSLPTTPATAQMVGIVVEAAVPARGPGA